MSRAIDIAELAELTRRRLAARDRRIAPDGPLIKAAVLIPIVDRGEPMIAFTKRTERVGHHKGQMSFPGGVVDPTDASLLDAALRECEEEVGLPRTSVDPLGTLDDTETVATSFVITPFVGLVRGAVAWQPDGEEIEKVIEVPFAALAEEGSFRVEAWDRNGVERPVYFFDYEGETIWGATARILVHYLDLVRPR
jgi:8-oxo-dGTP pyrophosphatase MutT (NUDIX family)